ncbi:MAG: diguanylate cyclase [Calditrichia bacterium]
MPRILVIDDNEAILSTLKELFKFFEYDVVLAVNGQEGIRMAELHNPDVIILDALMPVMNGFEACKYLKSHDHLKDIPVIFLSANYTDEESRMIGLELGAEDYLLKPFNTRELVAKVKSLVKRKYIIDNLRSANLELLRIHEKLKKEIEAVKLRSEEESVLHIEPTMGIFNSTFFQQRILMELNQCLSHKKKLTIAVINFDNLEYFQEIFDEMMFNYILIKIINIILRSTRESDVLGHLGQNKIGLLLPETDAEKALYELERIRAALSDENLINNIVEEIQKPLKKKNAELKPLTMTIAIAQCDEKLEISVEKFLKLITKRLNEIVERGGNKTEIMSFEDENME